MLHLENKSFWQIHHQKYKGKNNSRHTVNM